MKKHRKAGLILGMIIPHGKFILPNPWIACQSTACVLHVKTYLDLVLNLVSTNINYGKANESLADSKKTVLGGQLGCIVSGRHYVLVFALYLNFIFIMKGGQLKTNNPLTSAGALFGLYPWNCPILARYHFGRYYVNAGPSIAYQVYGTKRTEDITTTFV